MSVKWSVNTNTKLLECAGILAIVFLQGFFMSLPTLWKQMTRWQRSLLISTLSLGLYALLGFVVIPQVIQKQLVEQLSPITQRGVAVGEVSFNPFLLILSVKDFSVESKDPDQAIRLLEWQELYVDFELSSIFHLAWTFKEIRWQQPKVYLELQADGKFSFDDIAERLLQQATDEEEVIVESDSDGIPAIRMTRFVLSDAAFRLKDRSREGDNLLELSPISFVVDRFSTEADTDEANDYALKLVGQKGGSLEWDGAFSLRPVSSKGRLKLSNIDLTQFVEFYKDQLGFEMPTALLSFSTDYEVFQEPEWGVALSNGHYTIKDLKVYDKLNKASLLELPELAITGVSVNSIKQQALIEKISLKNTVLELEQYKSGSLNIDKALDFSAFEVVEEQVVPSNVSKSGVEQSSELVSEVDAVIESDVQENAENPNVKDLASREWYWVINEAAVESLALNFKESSQATPVAIAVSEFNAVVKNIHSDSRENVTVVLQSKVNDALLDVTAAGTLIPVSLEGGVALKGLSLSVAQPYVDPIAKAKINKGSLSTSLTYVLVASDAESSQAFKAMRLRGDLSIDDLSVKGGRKNRELLAWRSLALTSFDFDLLENNLLINLLSWDKPYVRTELLKDGSLNLENLLIEQKEEKESTAEASAVEKPFVLNIKKQSMKNGKIYFSDRTLTPNYVTSLDSISGYATGISNVAGKASKIDYMAKVDGHAPVKIIGVSNFMIEKPTLDMDILFKGVEMTSFTPYSGTYMGYKVKQGQITLTLDYLLKDDHLQGKNDIYINQFDFGDKVESEQATNLPVKLAVALLEDKSGKINIDMDIEGDVNDPDFSVKGLVWKVLKNVVVKAVSSPFSMLAGLGGDDEDLNVVVFAVGSTAISEEASKRLAVLAQALSDRPKLNLSVTGNVDVVTDLASLKERQVHQDVLQYLHQKGKKKSQDGVIYQYPLPLTDQYVKDGFKYIFKERISDEKADELDAALSVELEDKTSEQEIELRFNAYLQALLVLEVVEQQALVDLANDRALQVKKNLVDVNTIAAERIFIMRADVTNVDSESQALLNLQ